MILAYTLFKSANRKRDLGFFFAIFGFTLVIETVLYVFLRAYEYHPLIIRSSPIDDGVLGNIISQFSISAVALLICVLRFKLKGIAIFGLIFYLIEKFFVAIGIYVLHWYKPMYTLVGFPLLFLLIKKWYRSVSKNNSEIIHYFTVLLGIIAIYLPTTNWIGILTGFYVIKKDLLIDPFISHAVVVIPKYLFVFNMAYFLLRHKAGWFWNAAFTVVLFTVDAVLYYSHIMYVKEGWLLIYTGISLFTAFLYIYIMEKLLDVSS